LRENLAMAEQPTPNPPSDVPVRTLLQQLAAFLRGAIHLGPEARQTLADLVLELSQDLNPYTLPVAEKEHLAQSIAQLTQALQQRPASRSVLTARGRLEQALIQAETEAPVTTGVLRRLIDALANLGI